MVSAIAEFWVPCFQNDRWNRRIVRCASLCKWRKYKKIRKFAMLTSPNSGFVEATSIYY